MDNNFPYVLYGSGAACWPGCTGNRMFIKVQDAVVNIKSCISLYCVVLLVGQLLVPSGEIILSQRFAFVYFGVLFITGVMACLASGKKLDAPPGLFLALFVVFAIGLPVVRSIYS